MQATLKIDIPPFTKGSIIEIEEFISLGHYSSHLGYFNLRLKKGVTLKMVHSYNDLRY